MQATSTRLHPLLAVAAVSLSVLCGVGVASLTGLVPLSKGEESPLQIPSEVIKPIEPAISHPVAKPAAPKPVARKAAARAAAPVADPESVEAPQQIVEATKPQPLPGQLAVVESVREVKEPGDAKGVGAIAGGVVGGVLAGHQIEKQARADKRWQIGLRLDDGSQRTLSSETEPAWRTGDRVRLLDDKLQPA
jgi:outer membrane lipoprotein SlyB